MRHRETISGYNDVSELVVDVADLRYDAVAAFLRALAGKLRADGAADLARGRPRLATQLDEAADHMVAAAEAISRAGSICKPHMEP
jgi:hypothetical protein